MKKYGLITSMAVGLILSTIMATGLFAQDGKSGSKGAHGKGQKMEQALAKLDLTDQQKAEIQRLKEAFLAKNEAAIDEIKGLREKMREQKQSGDKEGAQRTREQIKSKQQALKESGQELWDQIIAVLTEEQKAQLKEMKGKMGKRGKKNQGQ